MYRNVHLCMDVMPGLSGATALVHPYSAILIEISCVKREEGPEQRVLGVVIPPIRDVDASHKPDQPPPPGAVPEVSIADDSLLVMSVERGDKLAPETQPASLPPGDICANHISSLHTSEIRNQLLSSTIWNLN